MNKKLAEECGADVGDVTIHGNSNFKIIFSEESFAKFCKKLVKSTAKDNLHTIRLYRAFLDTLIEEWNDHCGTTWEGDFSKLVSRIETDLDKEAYV